MAEFAHADELQTYLGLDPGGGSDDRLQQAVELASGAVQSWCRQRLELVEDDELTFSGTWERELFLPERPVISVSQVKVGTGAIAQTLDPAIYTWNRRGRLLWSPPQQYSEWMSALTWAGPLVDVSVKYTHGYPEAEIPSEVKLATLRTARRLYELQGGEEQTEQVGVYSLTIDTALQLIEAESSLLARYRRRAGSLTVGIG